jgi:GT2 family glycosyltransferase/glycosyltransferase involved in cell wall biosynthesis
VKLGWASSFKQRIRFTPLHLALVLADAWARGRPQHWSRPPTVAFRPGLSVLIPERGTPEMLAESLTAAVAALARIDEPGEVVVVVNGAPDADYAELRAQYPQVRWQFHTDGLGYNGAIAAGLGVVAHDWVYLLNSDMRIEPDALAALLPMRAPEVFAITSQIFFVDVARRREETGWSDAKVIGATVEMFERDPGAGTLARGNLYPGGGSSLCQTAALKRYVAATQTYSPFYYEDADWGARAWAEGFEVLFCPASRAHHHHRGTVARYFDAAEVTRVIARNALQFELRHGWTELTPARAMAKVCDNDYRTQQELYAPALARGVFDERLRSRRARARGFDFTLAATDHWYPRPQRPRSDRPRVLLVTPFALFPPAHGGARRVAELTRRLGQDVDLILLSDERSLYGPASEAFFGAFRSVHIVEGRGDQKGEATLPWPQRLQRHVHPAMRAELERLIAVYDPDLVQVEFMELAALRPARPGRARWLLSLHDVYLDGGAHDAVQRRALKDFAAVTVCSAEDAALLNEHGASTPKRSRASPLPQSASAQVRLIPNGATARLEQYQPSPQAPELLFMGPFRYAPNFHGIRAFLRLCWPAIRERFPDATLSILGGPESAPIRHAEPLLRQPGVQLIDRFVDPTPFLERASLTINPQQEIRGSALKLIESLLAGRICVSTREGARGFHDTGLAGLVIVDDVAAMTAPIIELLGDATRRHAIERPADSAVAQWTWDGIAQQQLQLYRELLGKR